MQLLKLIESKMKCDKYLTGAIEKIGKLRIEADHKMINEEAKNENHVNTFVSMCGQLSEGLNYFCQSIKNKAHST